MMRPLRPDATCCQGSWSSTSHVHRNPFGPSAGQSFVLYGVGSGSPTLYMPYLCSTTAGVVGNSGGVSGPFTIHTATAKADPIVRVFHSPHPVRTGRALLRSTRGSLPLAFLPNDQPSWTPQQRDDSHGEQRTTDQGVFLPCQPPKSHQADYHQH